MSLRVKGFMLSLLNSEFIAQLKGCFSNFAGSIKCEKFYYIVSNQPPVKYWGFGVLGFWGAQPPDLKP